MILKVCNKCFIEKSILEFQVRTDSKDGYRNQCKLCIYLKHKNWKLSNYDKHKKSEKLYLLKNKDKIATYKRKWFNEKLKNDSLYRLRIIVKRSIKDSFRNKNLSKLQKSHIILGSSIEEFKVYLESKFESWMNWNNYGLYNGELNYGWDMDHIIPISLAKNEEDIIKLNHYTNFQPLCSKINRDIKKNKIKYE